MVPKIPARPLTSPQAVRQHSEFLSPQCSMLRMTSAMLVALLLGLLCMATECAALDQVPRSGIFLLQQKSLRTPNALSRSLDTVRKQTQRLGSKISRNYGLQKSPRMQLTATNSLLIANIVAYLGTLAFPQLKYALMKVDNRILRGESYRLLSALFAHGSVSHLVMNCLSLSNIGPQAERIFGPTKFLAVYLSAGVLANAATFFAGTAPYSLGASACTFGLLGALGGYYFLNRDVLGRRSEAVMASIKRNLLINAFYGLSIPNVDHWAHAAGFGAGVGMACLLAPRLGSAYYSRRRAAPYGSGGGRGGRGGGGGASGPGGSYWADLQRSVRGLAAGESGDELGRRGIGHDYDEYGDLSEISSL